MLRITISTTITDQVHAVAIFETRFAERIPSLQRYPHSTAALRTSDVAMTAVYEYV
jgi:hypothetical protein